MRLPRNNFISLPGIGALLLALPASTLAQHAVTGYYAHHQALDFSLSLQRSDLDLRGDGRRFSARAERVSVTFLEGRAPGLRYGLTLGSGYVGLDGDPPSEGRRPGGYHLGLGLNARPAGIPGLSLSLRYLYQQARDETPARRINLDWQEWEVEASLRVPARGRWGLVLGGGYAGVDIRRRSSGDINDTLQVDALAGPQGRLELELRETPSGRIALGLQRGVFNGVKLSFARRFYY